MHDAEGTKLPDDAWRIMSVHPAPPFDPELAPDQPAVGLERLEHGQHAIDGDAVAGRDLGGDEGTVRPGEAADEVVPGAGNRVGEHRRETGGQGHPTVPGNNGGHAGKFQLHVIDKF